MSASISTEMPLYILKWKLRSNERGRKHMAVFVPNPQCKEIGPLDSGHKCLGTIIHVQGSPFTGFELNIKRNWSQELEQNLGSAHFLSQLHTQYAPEPPTAKFLAADPRPNGLLDQIASATRPPGVSSPLWDAEAIFDCQDWVYDYVTRLSQRGVVEIAVLGNLQTFMDTKTALMAPPGSGATQGSASTETPVLTASIVRMAPQTANQPAQPTRGRYSNSEWDTARKVFKRYDNMAGREEFRDSDGNWKPLA